MRLPRGLCRFAVVAMYGVYAAGAVMQWRVAWYGADRAVILTLFATAFAIGLLLFAATNYLRWSAAKDRTLDEREIAARNAIYRRAYAIMAWLSVALVLVWYAAPLFSAPLTPATNGQVLFWGYVLVISTLPAALLAWKDRPAI